ncbi:hypothetical protein C2845_PM09G13360 [Panicum miliaceum]|uniref:Uncharacterized protein n=1 Tax=Panicum miliaceum TaxID=4540 RepID=A0A3L6RYH9_PANMI|nr:hypothetical protein C2845_PM09G13360 [Panicum miliaceum]
MQYLSEEFDRLDNILDLLLSTPNTGPQEAESGVLSDDNIGGVGTKNLLELVELQDPDRVKQKGRPALPTRLKPLIEEIRRKMAKEEKKKENKKNKAPGPSVKVNKRMRKGEQDAPQSPDGKPKKNMRKGQQDTRAGAHDEARKRQGKNKNRSNI